MRIAALVVVLALVLQQFVAAIQGVKKSLIYGRLLETTFLGGGEELTHNQR